MKTVLLIGTLDTKGREIAYLRDRVRALGLGTLVLDSGILGQPLGCEADIGRSVVARRGGYELYDLQTIGTRGAAVERMIHGVERVTLDLLADGLIDGLISLGGAEGAVLGAAAAKVLPVGFPKIIVSPIASGQRRFGMFMGTRDVLVMHSVIDILGINPISTTIFDNAAAAVWGMLQHGHRLDSKPQSSDKRYVAVTMLGNTTTGVMAAKDALETRGYEAVIFHSNGVGGPAMEEQIAQGMFVGVIDYTTNELSDPLLGGFHAAPGRLEKAGELGLPQVVVPGCVDFACFGARHAVPETLRDRPAYYHNPEFTLIRLNRDEMAAVGATMARKLNAARGPVIVLMPTGGLSIPNVPGGAFYDPEADAAFLAALRAGLRGDIPLRLVEAHVNDPAFGQAAAEAFLELMTRDTMTG
ncbi:MAG: Tm-1-like ATP-binding domain-containing protein [Roseiflexaceae bacterium]